jgi:hypothetical protein
MTKRDLLRGSVLLSPAQRYHESLVRLRTETAQAVGLIEQLHDITANLRQLVIGDKVHLDSDSAKRLAEIDGLSYAALVLCRTAHDLSERLPTDVV